MLRRWHRGLKALALGALLALGWQGRLAADPIVSEDFAVTTYASGLTTTPSGRGPLGAHGLAFGPDGAMYAAEIADGQIYRIPVGGGTPVPILPQGYEGGLSGLVWSDDNTLYASQLNANRVIEIDPATGAELRILAIYIA
jgi:sugar lactone lactonase YvrE